MRALNVVFVFSDYPLHNQIIPDYLAARPKDEVSIVKVPLVLKGKGRAETARRIVPRLSKRFFSGKLAEFFVLASITLLPKLMRRGAVFRRLRRIARRHRLPYLRTGDIMSGECLAFLRGRKPDVIVTLFHQILRMPLIEIPRLGVVNIHPGLIPEFRGIQPYFWELSEGSGTAGATLHLIEDEGIDTGGILARAVYDVAAATSVQLNYYLTSRAASQLLPTCLQALEEGRLAPRPQDPQKGAYYRWPDSGAFDRLKQRGHALIKTRQLWDILSGVHDTFCAEEDVSWAP